MIHAVNFENQLHWNFEVTFKEDASRVRKGFAAQNLFYT